MVNLISNIKYDNIFFCNPTSQYPRPSAAIGRYDSTEGGFEIIVVDDNSDDGKKAHITRLDSGCFYYGILYRIK